MRSTSRPGCSRCMARSCASRRRADDVERAVACRPAVYGAAVGRVGEPADLALVAVVAERVDVERRPSGRGPTAGPELLMPGDHHHPVRGPARAVGVGRVVAALGGDACSTKRRPMSTTSSASMPGRRAGEPRARAPRAARAARRS